MTNPFLEMHHFLASFGLAAWGAAQAGAAEGKPSTDDTDAVTERRWTATERAAGEYYTPRTLPRYWGISEAAPAAPALQPAPWAGVHPAAAATSREGTAVPPAQGDAADRAISFIFSPRLLN